MYRTPAVAVVMLSSVLALSGCFPSPPPASPGPPSDSAPTAMVDPSPMPTVVPSPTPTVAVAGECSELLDSDSLAAYDGTGFGLPSAADITAYVDKIRAEGSPLALFVDGGGLLCPITNGTRVAELFGFSPISAAEAATQKATLTAEGLILSPHLGGELFTDASGNDNVVFGYLFAGDYWFCAIDTTRLDEVVANSGAAI